MKINFTMIIIIFIISVIICMAALIFLIIFLPWIGVFMGMILSPSPAKPEITYGEFPFRLEYEIDGKREVVEDTLICEYDGIGMNEGLGKYRKWKEYLASENKNESIDLLSETDILLLKISDNNIIYYSIGAPSYYMGDMIEGSSYSYKFPNALIAKKEGTYTKRDEIYADELHEKYKIKLISWEYTEPIKNTFISKR